VSSGRIVVAGAGPVGLSFACACRGIDVEVVDAAPQAAVVKDDYDMRVFAVSPGTRSFLRDIEAWERIDPARIAPVRRMEIFGDNKGKLAFSGRAGMPLAWIVEGGRLTAGLEEQAAALPNVSVRRGARVVSCTATESRATVTLDGGETIESDLVVGADGPDSPLRSMLALEADEVSYEEIAIVANFATEQPHGDVARQWFRADGVLAWLPLPGKRISIVWSAPSELAGQLLALDAPELAARVAVAGGHELGALTAITPAAAFELSFLKLPAVVGERLALVGDAAHGVHPLAGQGVNLGFGDAAALAAILGARGPVRDAGAAILLERYARRRAGPVLAMQLVTDGLVRLFDVRSPWLRVLRNRGMRAVGALGMVKRLLAQPALR